MKDIQREDDAPRAAYVHIPFCRHRCGYCNFTVVAGRDDLTKDYLRAVEIELSWLGEPQPVDTLFLGGGTPTHLGSSELQQLFELLRHWFPLAPGGEFSVEANPEDIDVEKVDALAHAGVNRVSLGVQSFDDRKLKLLERAHNGQDVAGCIQRLQPRMNNISIDLIFGAPGEDTASWTRDLDAALSLQPNHISTYGLTYEEGTNFFVRRQKAELQAIGEETECEMYEWAIDHLTKAEFDHYEVSNFAQPGFRCRHNENYWLCGEFFGIGPGAASYVAGTRRTNHRSTTTYLRRVLAHTSPVEESDTLSAKDRAHEMLVFGLRRLDGIPVATFAAKTGFQLEELCGESLSWLLNEELLSLDGDCLKLTRKGLLVSDSIWPHLL